MEEGVGALRPVPPVSVMATGRDTVSRNYKPLVWAVAWGVGAAERSDPKAGEPRAQTTFLVYTRDY